nr:hypothetical protein CFP56_49063 [Quercus suber]
MKVADLIDHELHCWKSDQVDAIFIPMEAKVIKAIPLSLMDTQDWLYWPKNRNGVYSIKFGYKLACEWDELAAPGVSDQTEGPQLCGGVCKYHLPNLDELKQSSLWGC